MYIDFCIKRKGGIAYKHVKKFFVSLCVVILLLNIMPPVLVAMAASKSYDYEELMQYDGSIVNFYVN